MKGLSKGRFDETFAGEDACTNDDYIVQNTFYVSDFFK